jgi:hypothetical protein
MRFSFDEDAMRFSFLSRDSACMYDVYTAAIGARKENNDSHAFRQ